MLHQLSSWQIPASMSLLFGLLSSPIFYNRNLEICLCYVSIDRSLCWLENCEEESTVLDRSHIRYGVKSFFPMLKF